MTAKNSTLTVERLREVLNYSPEAGEFTWRPRLDAKGRRVGDVGRTAGHGTFNGYIEVGVCGERWYAHRLAWMHYYGEQPSGPLDHIDGDRTNNRISNLRLASEHLNSGNRGPNKNNRSGFKGVFRSGNRWAAQISIRGKHTHLGVFDSPEEASAAYQFAAKDVFGEFARA